MQFKKGYIIKLKITDLAFGGAGVGKLAPDNFVVFVERTVPGDYAKVRLTKIKKQYAEATLEEILTPSPDRITARCRHFGVCGGCSLQFLEYKNQLKWKEKIVADALRNIGGFDDLLTQPIIGCRDPWFYRNKMEYTFGFEGIIGLHPKNNYREVFDLQACFLQSPDSVEILHAIKAWVVSKKLSSYNPTSNEGLLKNLVIREGKNTGEIMVNLITAGDLFPHDKEFAQKIFKQFPSISSLYRTGVLVQRNRRTVMKEHHLSGKATLTETLTVGKTTLRFEILPQAFFQPNTKQAEILYEKNIEFAKPNASHMVLDLFCGTGTIGMFFAPHVKHVIGIDLNSSAIENARSNAQMNNIKNIEFQCGDISSFLYLHSPSQHSTFHIPHFSLIITDPPRAGIAEKSLKKILELRIPKWIYVSCNPVTLSRDLKIICADGSYQIKKVQPIDMFPHTYHIETICLLTL